MIFYRRGTTTFQYETSNLSVTINGLIPGTEYAFNYYGKNTYGTGPYMPYPVYATTNAKIDYWSWDTSNGNASPLQTGNAYKAISNHGMLSDFSYLVWNDLVHKVSEILNESGTSWSSMYASLSETLMSASDKEMTAKRFNALRQNIGAHVSGGTGISEVSPGDIIYGSSFIVLANKINDWIDEL